MIRVDWLVVWLVVWWLKERRWGLVCLPWRINFMQVVYELLTSRPHETEWQFRRSRRRSHRKTLWLVILGKNHGGSSSSSSSSVHSFSTRPSYSILFFLFLSQYSSFHRSLFSYTLTTYSVSVWSIKDDQKIKKKWKVGRKEGKG